MCHELTPLELKKNTSGQTKSENACETPAETDRERNGTARFGCNPKKSAETGAVRDIALLLF